MGRGRGQPVGHRGADVTERPVLEARRKGEQLETGGVVGDGGDRAVGPARTAAAVLGGGTRGAGREGLEGPGQGEGSRARGGGLQERASVDSGHRASRGEWLCSQRNSTERNDGPRPAGEASANGI